MNLTNEEKAKIFAMYLGCEVADSATGIKRALVAVGGINDGGYCYGKLKNKAHTFACFVNDFKLLLKSLEDITDEDCEAVTKIIVGDTFTPMQKPTIHYEDNGRKVWAGGWNTVTICFDGNIEWKDGNVQQPVINVRNAVAAYQFLIHHAYAVPLYPYNQNAIELGIAINIATLTQNQKP